MCSFALVVYHHCLVLPVSLVFLERVAFFRRTVFAGDTSSLSGAVALVVLAARPRGRFACGSPAEVTAGDVRFLFCVFPIWVVAAAGELLAGIRPVAIAGLCDSLAAQVLTFAFESPVLPSHPTLHFVSDFLLPQPHSVGPGMPARWGCGL